MDDGSGETDEERKLRNESRKILEIPGLEGVWNLCTCASFHGPLSPDQRQILPPNQPGTVPATYSKRPRGSLADVPTPLVAVGNDPTYVGRIRVDETVEHGLALVLLQRQSPQGSSPQRRPTGGTGRGSAVSEEHAVNSGPGAPVPCERRDGSVVVRGARRTPARGVQNAPAAADDTIAFTDLALRPELLHCSHQSGT